MELQAKLGCSHNGCTFCGMYKDKKFRVRTLEEIETDIRMARLYYQDVEKVFLADGDALAMNTEDLIHVLSLLYQTFPGLRHVGIYAGPRSILEKSEAELASLKEKGLTVAYLGVETGDPELLDEVNKGVSVQEMVTAGRAVVRSGIKLSVTVILGLAGRDRERSKRHAESESRNNLPDQGRCISGCYRWICRGRRSLAVSALAIILGLIMAFFFKRRKLMRA
ncbi:radical SAM protein [Moorella sulfitireducens]|uniref:radical SAM protein n=1 Tax=Neomoorella sulfitireducens TaxID=2972948 RepID=UPI003BF4E909